jgi:hypothetical protein
MNIAVLFAGGAKPALGQMEFGIGPSPVKESVE